MSKKISIIAILAVLYSNTSLAKVNLTKVNDFDILVGGELGVEAGGRIQKNKYTQKNIGTVPNNVIEKQGVSANNKNLGMDSSAAAHIEVKNKSNSNFSYGVHMGMKTTTRSQERAGTSSLERSYIFTQGQDWGRVELGSNEGAAVAMILKGGDFDAGQGTWDKYVSFNTYTPESNFRTAAIKDSNFLTSARLIFQESKYETNHEAFRKVTYYTPKINGFQGGISYIPDATNKGGDNLYFPNQNNAQVAEEKDAFSGGLSWEKEFAKKHSINVALVGEIGQVESASATAPTDQQGLFNRAKAYGIGAKYIKDKLSLAAAYGNRGQSKFKKNIKDATTGLAITPGDSYFFNLGGAYEICDKTNVSLTYLYTMNNKNALDLIYLGANYKVMDGIKTYVEASYFKGKQKRNYDAGTNPTITTNQNYVIKGTALVTGMKISF